MKIQDMLKAEAIEGIEAHEAEMKAEAQADADAWKATQSTFARMLANVK